MMPKYKDLYANGYEAELQCPKCDGSNLHHERVEVFECGEDAKTGVHVVVANGKATVDTSLDGNPSARRHGLRIHFSCETCDAQPVMSVAQHKGSTYFDIE
jgi:hypothetical protein